jgi:hypothetical protein
VTRQPSSETSDQDRMSRFDTSIAHPARVYDWPPGHASAGPARRVAVRYHGEFAYVSGQLPDGTTLPLIRLRYNGSAIGRMTLVAEGLQGRAVTGVRGREVVAGQRAQDEADDERRGGQLAVLNVRPRANGLERHVHRTGEPRRIWRLHRLVIGSPQ